VQFSCSKFFLIKIAIWFAKLITMHFICNMQVIETCGCHDFDDQIIKNGDLEELHEFRSETFGTLYYGKWRGIDVAIKRFKKSCFAGGSSEQ